MPAIYELAPVFAVKVSRRYFSTGPQGAREKFGLGTRLWFSKCATDYFIIYDYSIDDVTTTWIAVNLVSPYNGQGPPTSERFSRLKTAYMQCQKWSP